MTSDDLSNQLSNSSIDYVTTAAKAALGLVPFAGSLLAEVAGAIIPRQRIDRIADFAARLEARIAHLECRPPWKVLSDEEFTDLTEESLRQASRATTPERREYLASMLASSLSSDAISYAETKHLMRILGELNDVEIVWLRFYANPVLDGDHEFRARHAKVLERSHVHMESPTEDMDKDAIQESYTDHLLRLGLLSEQVRKDRNGSPEFDRHSGKFQIASRRTSSLGELLLRQIGLTDWVGS